MIKIILKGGLGNQMFQYAAAKAISLENNTDLYLDLTYLKTKPPIKDFTLREFELNLFGIEERSGALLNIDIFDKYFSYALLLSYNKLLNKNYYIEGPNPYAFDESVFTKGSTLVLEGYFTNLKYFHKYEDIIKKTFDLEKFYNANFDEIENKIKSLNSVSVNIRRGDYLNNKHKGIFTYLDEDYYNQAISRIREKIPNPHFFVFSYDDPKWFEDTFKMNPSEYTMIDNKYTGEKFKTYLRLISLCKNNIISNSTFAWWGAYLNKNQSKIVISPKKWMHDYDFDIPSDWITIENE